MKWFKNLNTPNKLTVIRMFCVILLIVFALIQVYVPNLWSFTVLNGEFSWVRIVILFLFVFGSFTDYLDGNIARKRNIVTTFGKFLDPIADKLLVNTLTIVLAIWGDIPMIIPIIYIFRDTVVDAIRMIAVQKNVVIAASKLGKAKTVSQMVALIIAVVFAPYTFNSLAINIIVQVLMYISAAISLISGIEYFWKNRKYVLEGANDK